MEKSSGIIQLTTFAMFPEHDIRKIVTISFKNLLNFKIMKKNQLKKLH